MPSVWTSPFTATTSTVISSSDFNAGVRDNLLYLRQFLSANPSTSGQLLLSSGANSAGWVTPTDSALLTTLKVLAATPLASSFTALQVANGSGFYEVNTPGTGGPTGSGTWYCYNLVETNVPTGYGVQIAIDISDQNAFYMHVIIAGVAGAWQKIWHAGNDGAGSGLDADLLDGQSSAFYATASSVAALVGVPAGAVVWFRTAAEVTAAGASWAVETNLAGRFPIGAGTTFTQTFVEATNYGSNWTPLTGATIAASGEAPFLASPTGGTTNVNTSSHSHVVPTTTWLIPSRAGVFARRV